MNIKQFKKNANTAGEHLLNGHNQAMEEIIDLFQKKIYNLAYRYTCDKNEAYDLSQEIFMRLFSKKHLFTQGTDFHSWFMRLAVNTAINYHWKTKKRTLTIELSDYNGANSVIENSNKNDGETLNHQISSLLLQLPKRERLAISLQTWDARSVKEIAEIMETSNKAVEALLTRARRRLRKIIKK